MGRMSQSLREIVDRLDKLTVNGNPDERELAASLIHQITDAVGRSKWGDSTRAYSGTPSVNSKHRYISQKKK